MTKQDKADYILKNNSCHGIYCEGHCKNECPCYILIKYRNGTTMTKEAIDLLQEKYNIIVCGDKVISSGNSSFVYLGTLKNGNKIVMPYNNNDFDILNENPQVNFFDCQIVSADTEFTKITKRKMTVSEVETEFGVIVV